MIRRASVRALRHLLRRPEPELRGGRRNAFSTKPDDLKPQASERTRSRIIRLTSRLPKFLQGYTTPLIHAPLTHISAFLLLHELTAVIPLFGLAGVFHYLKWMPPFISEGKWISDGVEKFGKYFRKKGWLGEEGKANRYKWWGRSEGGTRIVVECASPPLLALLPMNLALTKSPRFATAYAITKALLPLRLILSVWATPWFARVAIIPLTNAFRKLFSKKRTN